MAGSQPAGSNRDAGSITHADTENANTNALTHPVDQYADCIPNCYINGDAVSHTLDDSYVNIHGHPYAHADSDPEAADCDSLSDAYSTAYHCAGGKAGYVH